MSRLLSGTCASGNARNRRAPPAVSGSTRRQPLLCKSQFRRKCQSDSKTRGSKPIGYAAPTSTARSSARRTSVREAACFLVRSHSIAGFTDSRSDESEGAGRAVVQTESVKEASANSDAAVPPHEAVVEAEPAKFAPAQPEAASSPDSTGIDQSAQVLLPAGAVERVEDPIPEVASVIARSKGLRAGGPRMRPACPTSAGP